MDRFEAMRAYVQVVESGGYTKAAQVLKLHKATISQHVQLLERRVGARLLMRTTRSVAPTAEGLAYYQRAVSILQQLDETESALRRGIHSPAGRLRVDVPAALGRYVLVPEIGGFLDRYPHVTLELGCTDRAVDLIREGVDCAIRGGDLPDSTLVGRRIGAVSFVLCAAPRYLDQHGAPQRPGDLARHARIAYMPALKGKLRDVRLMKGAEVIDVAMPTRFVTTDSGALLNAGVNGLGIIEIGEYIANMHIATGALLRVLPSWTCPVLPLHIVTPPSRHRTARVQAFIDWAQEVIARRMNWRGGSS
jgi:LysR family transcriptional regulator for bpeEF and oprC